MYDHIIRTAPTFGEVAPPMSMVMYEIMNSEAGFSALTKDRLNKHYKKMMQSWILFLKSPGSLYVFHDSDGGWLSHKAMKSLVAQYPDRTFDEVFICNKAAPSYGFTSYEDFFTRRYRNIQRDRPLEDVGDLRTVSAPCESSLYAIQEDVQEIDTLFIKSEAYSLHHLLCGHESVPSFVGGTVMQCFLSTTDYHRWHAPVNGTIKHIVSVPGTYFAQAPNTLGDPYPIGCPKKNVLPAFLQSLVYFSNTATCLIIFIEAENKAVGLMCFVLRS
jgi:hypothetical protein